MRALPPNGWWITDREDSVAVHGWDWAAGASTLVHGVVTLPGLIWLLDRPVLATTLWAVAALVLAAGIGFRVVVDRRGMKLSRTWMGMPLWGRRLPDGTPVGEGHAPYAPHNTDQASFVSLGGSKVGNSSNARFIAKAIRKAQGRFELQA
jgi:hypothetical protein